MLLDTYIVRIILFFGWAIPFHYVVDQNIPIDMFLPFSTVWCHATAPTPPATPTPLARCSWRLWPTGKGKAGWLPGGFGTREEGRVLHKTKVFNFDAVQFIFFFLLWVMLLVSCIRTLHVALGPKDFLLCFLLKALHFTWKSPYILNSFYTRYEV